MEYLPGVLAYLFGGFSLLAIKTFIWKIANHWSKIWVADYWAKTKDFDVSQSNAQTLSLSVILTAFILAGIALVIWSIANYINCKNTENGFPANVAGGIGIVTALGQDSWLNEIATSITTYAD